MTDDDPRNREAPLTNAPPSDSALAMIAQGLCEASGKFHLWSPVLLASTCFFSCLFSFFPNGRYEGGACFWAALVLMAFVLAALETFLAGRLAFDRPVFSAWARLQEKELSEAQRDFDAAIVDATTSTFPKQTKIRPMQNRLKGIKRLCVFQILCLAGQGTLLLVSLLEYVHAG